jgi:cell division protein ZapB
MSDPSQIDQITERVERLLVRYEELMRTNALLNQQIDSVTQERDSLKSRLGAARARVDALLERLPCEAGGSTVKPAFKTAATRSDA